MLNWIQEAVVIIFYRYIKATIRGFWTNNYEEPRDYISSLQKKLLEQLFWKLEHLLFHRLIFPKTTLKKAFNYFFFFYFFVLILLCLHLQSFLTFLFSTIHSSIYQKPLGFVISFFFFFFFSFSLKKIEW